MEHLPFGVGAWRVGILLHSASDRYTVLCHQYTSLLEPIMLFAIQTDSPVPIYEQIVAQVTYAVASGALEAGAMIPSVRELAGSLVVNPNTVARAYQELEQRGVVTAKRGRGMEV